MKGKRKKAARNANCYDYYGQKEKKSLRQPLPLPLPFTSEQVKEKEKFLRNNSRLRSRAKKVETEVWTSPARKGKRKNYRQITGNKKNRKKKF
jgi:hypothetical protein